MSDSVKLKELTVKRVDYRKTDWKKYFQAFNEMKPNNSFSDRPSLKRPLDGHRSGWRAPKVQKQ